MVAKFGEGGGFTATASEITPLKKKNYCKKYALWRVKN